MSEVPSISKKPVQEVDDRFHQSPEGWAGAVLLSDEIERYCDRNHLDPPLIDPFDPTYLRPASYDLTLGEEIHVGGVPQSLTKTGVSLGAHQVAVVSTAETLNIPRYLIARWNLRVSKVYEGLLWTGGAQVDPGFRGKLYCPVYNLQNKPVWLRLGETFFSIDFVRTTVFHRGNKEFPADKWGKSLAQYDFLHLQSAPYELIEQVKQVREEQHRFVNLTYSILSILFVVIAAIIAALAFSIQGKDLVTSDVAFRTSISAAVLSIGALFVWYFTIVTTFLGGKGRPLAVITAFTVTLLLAIWALKAIASIP